MVKKYDWLPSKKDVQDHDLLTGMLAAQKQELDLLTKKQPNGQLNKMKITIVNRVLEPLKGLLKNEPSHKFLDVLNEVDMPTNSDVVLIISQYEKALRDFRSKYFIEDKNHKNKYGLFESRWSVAEDPVTEPEEG